MPGLVSDLVRRDLDEILDRSRDDLERIGGRDLVLTGATGFIGTWLTLSYLHARRQLGLEGRIHLVARRTAEMSARLTAAGLDGFDTVDADVRSLEVDHLPDGAWFVHAATPARATLNTEDPFEMIDIIVRGQQRILSLAGRTEAERVLFLSSGAVYGRQPLALEGLDEDWSGAPRLDDASNAYHEAKRIAELLGNVTAVNSGLGFVSARLFAFLAPFLPQDEHFAAGNFIGDAIAGRDIDIASGGGSVRSYQYATDMTVWLWGLLARGASGRSYNVGSDEAVSIRGLAELISRAASSRPAVRIHGTDTVENVTRYVPDISRAGIELGLRNTVDLRESIRRTLQWAANRG